ncbi:glycerophosphodiester phosphodiesterase [Candidatus Lokiarchaeum ossiferum]|uniref:glycerophosphodiester phosphodiesterase n=1 Tax=Candidatus Lokiarchaeum ossiferum TaxID=2951803 RepID=UPI00352EFF67
MGVKPIKKTFSVSIQAHRGFNKRYPENTLLAFQKAIEAKADYVELDVHLTVDHHIVVTHDYQTQRVADQDLIVAKSTLEQLKTLDFGQKQKIPTLQEVFDLCKGKIGINIEIKHSGLARPVNDLIIANEMENQVIISSFVHSEIAAIKKLNSNLICASLEPTASSKLGYLLSIFKRKSFIENAKRLNADATHPYTKLVNKKFCALAHANNLLVNPWTSDSPKEWQRLIDVGVDSIITNDPLSLYAFLEQASK